MRGGRLARGKAAEAVAVRIGAHAERLSDVRSLKSSKGRREQGRFAFEGPTLLDEARRSGLAVDELYATQSAYERFEAVRAAEKDGVATYIVDERSAARISDLETPPGIVAVAPVRYAAMDEILGADGLVLVLADIGDPGNAGTLLRSADAFGCRGVISGRLGVDPYHPKVVRAAMGSLFRLAITVGDPETLAETATRAGFRIAGLDAAGEPLAEARFGSRTALAVGSERHGLGRWESTCAQRVAIAMPGAAESLNAAIAGSIALYEAAKGRWGPPGR